MQRSSVDLPEPLGPITQATAPRATSRSTPLRTSSAPKLLQHVLELEDRAALVEAVAGSAVVASVMADPRAILGPAIRSGPAQAGRRHRRRRRRAGLLLLARDQAVDEAGERDRDEQEEDARPASGPSR